MITDSTCQEWASFVQVLRASFPEFPVPPALNAPGRPSQAVSALIGLLSVSLLQMRMLDERLQRLERWAETVSKPASNNGGA